MRRRLSLAQAAAFTAVPLAIAVGCTSGTDGNDGTDSPLASAGTNSDNSPSTEAGVSAAGGAAGGPVSAPDGTGSAMGTETASTPSRGPGGPATTVPTGVPQPEGSGGGQGPGTGGTETTEPGGQAGEQAAEAGAGGIESEPGTGGAADMGGASGSSGAAAGGEAGGSAMGGRPPVDCSTLAEAPAMVETLSGFATSEDFAFDLDGNYVGIDENQNLVRITKEGTKQLWAPSVGDAAGMGLLPDGSLVFCNVDEGSLQRVDASGSVTTVLGGLLYPNGMELGPDGFVYVAENAAGRVRRVNVETGEFTVVAMGLQGPNGVAFSGDPNVFYVGSFEGSGVYRVTMPSPGELGQASVFARPNGSQLMEPMLACPAMEEGLDCEVPGQFDGGTCRRLANVIDCVKDTTIAACNETGCTTSEYGGGIDGLGVDACGNVYASEYDYGNLWRVSPGGDIEKLAELPAMWIPNMRWGRGLGGFESNVLYVADRDEGRLFAVSVGVPAASSLFGAMP